MVDPQAALPGRRFRKFTSRAGPARSVGGFGGSGGGRSGLDAHAMMTLAAASLVRSLSMIPDILSQSLQSTLCQIAREAGAAIMKVYSSEFEVRRKSDHSPVTDADLVAEGIIVEALSRLDPAVSIVSEEAGEPPPAPAPGAEFWLVDPLDGTREFVRRNGEFTVNIALVRAGVPVVGAIYAPAKELLYFGSAGGGAFEDSGAGMRPIACRRPPSEGLRIITSRSGAESAPWKSLLRGRTVASCATMGSSLKFGVVAAGQADVYPRPGRTSEWDTAAGHAILNAAGGRVTDAEGVELAYGKPGFRNPSFIATGLAA
jgi:3'(2'), 5'-bisphosphate nucleotidase